MCAGKGRECLVQHRVCNNRERADRPRPEVPHRHMGGWVRKRNGSTRNCSTCNLGDLNSRQGKKAAGMPGSAAAWRKHPTKPAQQRRTLLDLRVPHMATSWQCRLGDEKRRLPSCSAHLTPPAQQRCRPAPHGARVSYFILPFVATAHTASSAALSPCSTRWPAAEPLR